jgi:hypothetical protein
MRRWDLLSYVQSAFPARAASRGPEPRSGLPQASGLDAQRLSMRDHTRAFQRKEVAVRCAWRHARRRAWTTRCPCSRATALAGRWRSGEESIGANCTGCPARYEIRVYGVLDDRWAEWFGGLQVATDGTQRLLIGLVPDQPALHGILIKIRDLGLCLISVHRVDFGKTGDKSAPRHAASHKPKATPTVKGHEPHPRQSPPPHLHWHLPGIACSRSRRPAYLRAVDKRPLVGPVCIAAARAIRAGPNLAPDRADGKRTWGNS